MLFRSGKQTIDCVVRLTSQQTKEADDLLDLSQALQEFAGLAQHLVAFTNKHIPFGFSLREHRNKYIEEVLGVDDIEKPFNPDAQA